MKINFSFFTAALSIILSAATFSFAQTDQITGGYGEADVKDGEVVKAAKFAVKKRSQTQKAVITLLSIKKAQVQVVSGLNYQLCLRVNVKRAGRKTVTQFVETVVYRNLKNRYSLTSWIISTNSLCKN
jgi:hypothetical protein